MHIAAANQVTGIPIPLIFFRLYIIPVYILIALQLYVLGRSGEIPHNADNCARLSGLLSVILCLMMAEISIPFHLWHPFYNAFIYSLYHSQTMVFGLIFFISFVLELGECLNSSRSERDREGTIMCALYC